MAIFVGLILFFGKVSTASAAISFGSASSGANAAAGATTLILTAPASISEGDFLVANIVVSGGGTITITPPTGWTLRLRTNNGNFIGLASYYKIATASEPGSYTWTLTNTRAAGGIARYTGVDTTNPFDTSLGGTGNNATVTAPSITTSQVNDMVIVLLGDLSTDTFATVAGATERFDVRNTSNPAAALDDYIQIVAGSTGAKTSLTAGNNRFAAQQIALRPLLPPTMPAAPTSTSNITTSSIQYNWTSGGGSGTYFQVERSTDGVSYSVIATTTVATTNYTFTGLSPNTQYWFRVASGNNVGLSSYVTSSPTYTLANVAGTPTVSSPTTSSLQLAIATNSNPSNTTYAIYNATLNTYVASNGSSNGATPAYFTSSTWNGTVTGLSLNTSYQFSIVARNGNGVNSATSSLSTALYTLANPALAPTVSGPSTSTVNFVLNANSNPSNTTYAIYNNTVGLYVNGSGLSNSATPVFSTDPGVSRVFSGLSTNTSYQFSVIARNGDGVTAATSSLSTALFTLANPALAPTVGSPTTSTLALTLNTNSNPSSTTYAIYNNTSGTYVAASGASNGATPVFFTSASWTGTVTGLSLNTSYQFSVVARNGDGINAATSSLSTAVYTLANTPGAPTVGSPTTSTLSLTIAANSNPSNTTYAIYNSTSNNYIAASGSSNGATPVYFTAASWTGTVTGLTSNTSYQFSTIARNGDNINTATSSLSAATSTTAVTANTPGTPTVSNPTTSTLQLVINTNGNNSSVTYAIYNNTSGNYIASNGSSNGGTPVYFASSSWNGAVTGLSINTSYQFSVIAKSIDNVVTPTSSLSTAIFTLANPALAATVGSPTTSTLNLAINVNSNPSNTTYAIYNATSNNYVAANGSSNGATPVFFTNASWTGTVIGLTSNTSYQFSVIARNGDSVNAATSSLSTATSTTAVTANVPGTPTLSNPTTSSIQITINTNGNDSSVTYALYNVTTGNYLTAAGASSASPVYFTSSTWNNGSATGLSINTSYQFSAIAKSTDNIVTATSSASTALYTLANPALAPTVGSPTTSTLALTINVNSNPANTTYAIYNNTSNNYVASNGSSNGGTPVFFTNASWNGTVSGLTSNTSYQFSVIARNGDNINAATSSLSAATSTLAISANTPGAPTLSNPTTSTIQIAINTNGNDSSVTYALYNVTTGNYLTSSGASSGSPVFFASSTWNNGSATGLSINTSYQFSAIAKSADNVVTATSTASSALYTLANPALAPTISNPTTTTLDLVISTNGNPSNTTYAIYNATSNNYVAANGSSNGGTPVFFTNASWNGTVTGLTSNTSYQFSVIGRNGNSVNTATSSLSTATTTLSVTANTPGTPTVSNPTTSTLQLVIASNGNDSSVTYAIYNTTSNNYVKADGTSNGATPVYFTNAGWNGTVKSLSLNTAYQFSVAAKSADNVVTASSSASAVVFTLATTPGAPTVSNPTTSTLDVALSTNGNPSNTTYAIYNLTSNSYVAANGSSNGGTPVYFTAASWTGTVTGLTSNTSYQFSAIAKNGDGIVTATSTASTATSTLAAGANTPGTPTVSNPTTSSLQLVINTNGNDSSVTYAIYNATSNNYIKADGSSNGATPVYFTNVSWNGTVTGLSLNTSYQFNTLAKSADNVITPTSSLSSALYTLANPALAPMVGSPTTSTLSLTINANSNPSNTAYAIYNSTSGNYVAANGSSNGGTPVFFTNASWNGTVTGLTSNTSYQFSVVARNGDNVNATTSSLSAATSTLSASVNTPGTPTVSNPTISTLDLAIDTAGNPTSTTYALFNNTTGNYLAANGSSNGSVPVFFSTSSWGGIVTGLSVDMAYQFSAIAKSYDNIISATSTASAAVYTLANPATAIIASNPSQTTLDVDWSENGNSATTVYALYNATLNNYVASNGLGNESAPVYFTYLDWAGTVSGLMSNTSYQFASIAQNGDGINAATSSLSASVATLPYSATSPTVSNPTTSTLSLVFNTGGNPTSTTYALYNVTNNEYVATDGTSNFGTPVFFATSSWNGTVFDLDLNTSYQFQAVSQDYVTSTASAPLFTLAQTPGAPTVSNATTSTIDLAIATNGNPGNTTFALYNVTSGNYIQSDGTSNANIPQYFTNFAWNGTVKNLAPNTTYQFVALARNGNGAVTATSSMSAPIATGNVSTTVGVPSISNPTTSTLDLVINTSGQAASTTYAIRNVTANHYLAADGSVFGLTPTYFSSSSWSGIVTGLSANTSYQFEVRTFNGDISPSSAALYTLATVPSDLTLLNTAADSVQIMWSGNGTNYYLENVTAGSNSGWISSTSSIASGLACNTLYSFRVKARNGNAVETAFSSTVATTTLACSAVSAPSTVVSVAPIFIPTANLSSTSSSLGLPTSTAVISISTSSASNSTAASINNEVLLVPLVFGSSISFSDLPEPGKIVRGDDLYFTYRYTASLRAQRYRIVREIINEQGGVVRRSVGYQYLRPGQNITSRVQEKETKNLAVSLYTYRMTVYDRENNVIDMNGFQFRIVDELGMDEEQLLVPLSPESSIVFTQMPSARVLKAGEYLKYTYSFTFTNQSNITERVTVRREVIDERGKVIVVRGGGYRVLKPGESFSYSPNELLPRRTGQGKYTVYVRVYNQKNKLIDQNSYYFRVK